MTSRWKFWILGFACGSGLLAAVNLYSYQRAWPIDDFVAPFGVPFPMGNFGGLVGQTHFVSSGVFANTIVALSAGVVLAWFFTRLWPLAVNLVSHAMAWHQGTRM